MWNEAKNLQDYIVKLRRDLHQIPEVGQELPQTAAYVRAELDRLCVSYKVNEGDGGLIATIQGSKPGKTIALRADMDALPILEETGLPFASTNGCMHACGHDTHTAMLLGAAKILQKNTDKFSGTVRLFFQTAEEICLGAKAIIDNGGMEGVDAVFGTHIGTIFGADIPSGTLLAPAGGFMASFDKFTITVKGIGCHGSTPEKGVDPVNIAAHIVLALQAINSREFNACVPVVVTIGSIHGGSQYNIIPNEVVIEGTVRCVDAEVRQKIARRIGEISAATASAFGGTATNVMTWGAPPVVNNAEMAALAAEAAKAALGEDSVLTELAAPNMGGEDFAFYLEKAPGCFMFLSASNPEKGTTVPHHNPKFDIDEDVLWRGAAVFVAIVDKYLNS